MERRVQDFFRGFHTGPVPPSRRDATQPNERANPLRKNVVDDVSLVAPNVANFDKQQLVQHIVFEDEGRVSLPQLIVLACATNDYSKQYQFFEKNCYWFCYIIGELLQRLSTPSFPDLSARGRQGTWLGLPAGSLWQEVDFDMLSAKYDTMWHAFENQVRSITEDSDITDANGSWQIESIINHPDNKHLEARVQAQEEKKCVEEAERSMEEEKRRAEELERQLVY